MEKNACLFTSNLAIVVHSPSLLIKGSIYLYGECAGYDSKAIAGPNGGYSVVWIRAPRKNVHCSILSNF